MRTLSDGLQALEWGAVSTKRDIRRQHRLWPSTRWPAEAVILACLLVVATACGGREGPRRTASSPTSTDTSSTSTSSPGEGQESEAAVQEFDVPSGSGPHDVAPAPDGGVWYTAQGSGELGHLDPRTGRTNQISLGEGSAPHGVIVGPDGAPWITDGGLNAIVRVDPVTSEIRTFPVGGANGNLNTATFDGQGTLWFTGQAGLYGKLDTRSGKVETFEAPKGRGPYGIATAPDGAAWFSSLAGSYIARIDPGGGRPQLFDVPTKGGGARRVWSDSSGSLWVAEWFAGKLARFDPKSEQWKEWQMPGPGPQPYAVFVDDQDMVWISDFGSSALVSFDPRTEAFKQYPLAAGANVRQILGRPGEVWGAESGRSRLVVIRTG
jgi:virginiamycin B lyase